MEGKALLALGLLYTVPKNNTPVARETLKLVEEIAPAVDGSVLLASLYTEWGRLLANLRQDKTAEDKFRIVADSYPSQVHARTELGRLLAKQPGREKEAEDFLREAIRIDPKNLHPHTELGRLLAKQPGREKEAEDFLREAMVIDPKHLQSRTELGRLLAKQPGREEEARRFLSEILGIDVLNCHARVEMAKLCEVQSRYAEAEQLYQEVLELDPHNTFALRGLKDLRRRTSAAPE